MEKHTQQQRIAKLVDAHTRGLIQALVDEFNKAVAGLKAPAAAPGRSIGERRRARRCIAPGCRQKSKGPRFKYLCADHRDAPAADIAAWQARKGA